MTQSDEIWWRYGIFYQIYPRSFQDSDGDGVGDITGIIDRLPYLQELGVDAVWLSPIFPLADGRFRLRHLRLYRHRSAVRHDGRFRRAGSGRARRTVSSSSSISCRTIPPIGIPGSSKAEARARIRKRDWYIWRDPAADGGPPNNWLSEFGGSAWEYDAATGQYYYHAFLAQQPDLNWRNPEVRQAIYDVMRFWLRKGVDGFRVDVIWHLIKDAAFPRQPAQPELSRRAAAARADPDAVLDRSARGA